MNRVLIVEDDAVVRRQLTQLFRFEHYEVVEAACGEAAVQAAMAAAPDLVVCDIMMPGMNGFGVLDALRGHPETALTPFIFLTAKAGGKDVRQGMSQGADDYITKPFEPDALLASARQRLLRRQRETGEAERRAADTGRLAAAALPREIETSLTHLERLFDALSECSGGQFGELCSAVRMEASRLRAFSRRLRLYAELPNIYARRFAAVPAADAVCPAEHAVDSARMVAAKWNRSSHFASNCDVETIGFPPDVVGVIVSELVDNACKFSPADTGIRLKVREEPGFCRILVADQGSGMTREQISKIGAFQQFWSGAERPSGLGIGLVLTQALIRLYGGEMEIESTPGAGTRVSVMAPLE